MFTTKTRPLRAGSVNSVKHYLANYYGVLQAVGKYAIETVLP